MIDPNDIVAEEPRPVQDEAGDVGASPESNGGETSAPVPLQQKQDQARAYIAKIEPAVEGQDDDRKMFRVACELVIDFALVPDDALPLMLEFNQRCLPPWSDEDLKHKLELANEKSGQRGRKLTTVVGSSSKASGECTMVVPDFMQWDEKESRPRPIEVERNRVGRGKRPQYLSRRWWTDIAWLAVVLQRRNPVILPDAMVAELVWGNPAMKSWPRNWRKTVTKMFPESGPTESGEDRNRTWTSECPAHCPLHARKDVRHRHLSFNADETLGQMRHFAVDDYLGNDNSDLTFDFKNRFSAEESMTGKQELKEEVRARSEYLEQFCRDNPEEGPDARRELLDLQRELKEWGPHARKVLCVAAIYMPVRIFGPSPLSGLTQSQCNVLAAITGEITRSQKSRRPDRAAVLEDGVAPAAKGESPVCECRLLGTGKYVSFNGNGHGPRKFLHGHGFKISTWMTKAGYPKAEDVRDFRPLLSDFDALRESFGLKVFAWNSGMREWKTLEAVLAMGRSKEDRNWLKTCVLRIYAPAGYLPRWRKYFAERLGFSSIPSRHDDTGVPEKTEGSIRSKDDLAVWKQTRGLSDAQLAELVGVQRQTINHYLTGRRAWSTKFEAKINASINA